MYSLMLVNTGGNMNYYDMFGMKIRTRLDFSNFLYRCEGDDFDFEIVEDEKLPINDFINHSEVLYRRFVYTDEKPCEVFFKLSDGGSYLLKWLDQYYFYIDPENQLLIVNSKLDGEFFAVLFSKILSFLLYIKGYSQLHGSAVRYQDKTLCFIGESGAGKSTCASLCVMDGGKFITDDVIAIHPKKRKMKSGIPSLRLSYTSPLIQIAETTFDEVDKLRVGISSRYHFRESSDINCFFFLEVNDDKGLSVERLKGKETILHLLSNVYGKHFLKNVFTKFLYEVNILTFTFFSNVIPMYKVYRHSNTKSEELFALIKECSTTLD